MRKNNIFIVIAVTLMFALAACNGGGGTTAKMPKLASEEDSLNYTYGLFNGSQLRMMMMQDSDSVDYRIKMFMDGVREGIAGKPNDNPELFYLGTQIGGWYSQQKKEGFLGDSTVKFDYAIVRQTLVNALKGGENLMTIEYAQHYIDSTLRALREQQLLKQYNATKEAGEKFLEENKVREEVVTTESGLQYEVVKQGTGPKPTSSDVVKVHYSGKLFDGTEFDSSYERGEPATFGVEQVIPGWTEGLQLMPVGSKYKFYIPFNLGYGGQGTHNIPPFSALVFDVELLEIVKN